MLFTPKRWWIVWETTGGFVKVLEYGCLEQGIGVILNTCGKWKYQGVCEVVI